MTPQLQVLPSSFEPSLTGELGGLMAWMPEQPLIGPSWIGYQIGLADIIKISFCMCWLGIEYLRGGIKCSTFPKF